MGQYGLCPGVVAPPAVVPRGAALPVGALPVAVTVPPNPGVLAFQFWQTVTLPVPKPQIPPGYAITGKPVFLVTNGTLAPASFGEATPLGPLRVTAHGAYAISWGDGATSGPFSNEGLPYPNGTIRHTYDNVGVVTVTVTVSWTATWTLGGAGGTLGGLRTVATIAAFPVRQIQAVITG